MKTELFAPVLAWLKAGAPHTAEDQMFFGMNHFTLEGMPNPQTNRCGTACCIAGAVNQFNKLGIDLYDSTDACYAVGRTIGMTSDQIENLFFAQPLDPQQESARNYCLEDVTPDLAARMLEQFIETGEACWPEYLDE